MWQRGDSTSVDEPEPPRPRITLIGTGHVFDIAKRVREEVRRRSPQVVGIELDPPRYHALRNKNKDKRGVPIVYRLLADFQTRIANEYGVEAGDEMIAASDEARDLGVPLALIDKDAQQTFTRLRLEMSLGEKARLLGSAIVGLLPILPGKSVEKQVQEMQEDYSSYFEEMGKKFPTLKRVLLDERNEHMARALSDLSKTNERVVAVIGDGHVDGILTILIEQGFDVETVRLKQLREKVAEPQGSASATLSFDLPSDVPPRL
jgi:pheromone shutdown protein TraB